MTEQFVYILCKEERGNGMYKLHPCYAPSSLPIMAGDIVTVALPTIALLCAYDNKLKRHYVLESAHDGTEIKSGLKVIERGGTITVNEADADFVLESFGRIFCEEDAK